MIISWIECAFARTNSFTEISGLPVFTGTNLRHLGNREKNLVNRCCGRVCDWFHGFIEVFEVGISSVLKGLLSLVRVATFNRDKNLVKQNSTGFLWWWKCLGQIVTNISQTRRLGLLRQGRVVKENTHSYALGPHNGCTSRGSRGDKVSYDMRGFFCRQDFPQNTRSRFCSLLQRASLFACAWN